MRDFFDPDPSRRPQQGINLEEIDFSGWRRGVKLGLLALAALVLIGALNWARSFYTDWLWFGNLNYEQVLLTVISTQVWLFVLGGLAFLLVAGLNLYLVFRGTRDAMPIPGLGLPPELYQTLRQLLSWAIGGILVLLTWLFASTLAGQWQTILLFLNSVPFGETDPFFGRDFSFYVFSLPVYHFLRGWLLGILILVALMVGGLYYLISRMRGKSFSFDGAFRAHVAVLGATAFVLVAIGHWLARYDLFYSPSGAVFGIGYTEAHATMPALYVMTLAALGAAVMMVASIFLKSHRPMLWAVGLWFGVNLLGSGVVPQLVQRLHVEPNELAREEPYLKHHIEMTRQAYGLDRVTIRSHPALGVVDPTTVAENQGTIQNVRLWDEGPLLQSYNQIQFFRLYYDFLSMTTDRYRVDDQLRQVMLSTRELSAEKLPQEAQRWVNRHLQFTHGYGVAMSPVTEVESGGRPVFFIQDVPPRGVLPLERPEVYYGLKSLDYVVVRSGMQEFNYPGDDAPVYTRYEGEGGVVLSSFLRSFLYALQFGDLNLLISTEILPESRIQYRRTLPERFSTLTPFLMRDRDPYVVTANGRLYWIQDAYTVTDRFPYSVPFQRGRFNYIRNSVKAVIDAYEGTVDYYVSDPADPLIQAYSRIFPDLFRPLEEMPDYLKPHIRYPQDFFTVQTQMLLQYHMQEPGVFYNREDQWDLPLDHAFGRTSRMDPYYMVARLPAAEEEEFLLIQPFTPVNRHNLVSWLAARSDLPNYGELVLFRFPSGRHVDGPYQVGARIDNDAVISEQFTLWGQVGSEVSRGRLLVIPLGDSIFYAEPVYLRPEALEFPELRRIILADSRQVVMHPTLDNSLAALVGELPAVAPPRPEVDDEPVPALVERREPALRASDLESVRIGLQDVVRRLQEVIRELELADGAGGGGSP